MNFSPTPNMIAEKAGAVGRLVFNKPQKHNATSTDMWEAIPVILDEFEKDPAIRVVVVTGAGDKAFVSGADISEFEKARSTPEQVAYYDKIGEIANARLTKCSKPTIARIRGYCIGGGLAVPYEDEDPPDLKLYGRIVREVARRTKLEILVEPGRFMVADAGTLLTRVLYRKRSGGREIAVTDAGMTELLRPSHYQAYHHIEPVRPRQRQAVRIDVVGPVCESGDFLALDREMPDIEAGDLMAVRTAGAYGYSMASNYNARPRAVEVLVDGDKYAVTTAREEYQDLIRLEYHPLDWKTT